MAYSRAELLLRMHQFEDNFVERKTVSDRKDWLKTAVAFANSTPEARDAILFIGVTDRGEIQDHNNQLDTLQKTFDREIQKAYPPIDYHVEIVDENSRVALAVIIPFSAKKPHFAGPAYIRRGSQSIEANEPQFKELIARRNSKVTRLLDLKGKVVTVMNSRYIGPHLSESFWGSNVRVWDCDQFMLTLATSLEPKDRSSFGLQDVELLFDHANNRPLIKLNR